jgi:2-(1,2-epoxy-1,2-dihydrophenyl)acetyl-CoA isomerase
MDTPILYTVEDQVGRITLNRPDVFNSFNREMALQLQNVLDECRDNADVRAVLLTGAGKAFCAGQDLKEMTGEDAPSFPTVINEHYNPIIRRLRELPKPVVCLVNGVAAGAGANIALACDITVAVESASFIQAFSKIGLVPDSGGTFHLPRLVGWQRAAAFMMLGEKVSARDAANMGMIYLAVPDDEGADKAKALAAKLAKMPTKGLALTKRALNYACDSDLERQLAIECELQDLAGRTHDYQEGVQAFLEKRKPNFKGE